MKENKQQLSDQIQERFISYYTRRFPSDLKSFYDIRRDFGDRTYPFVLSMACNEHSNTHRRFMKWDDNDHFYMFSVSVFFTSMCTQVIGKLYGWFQMENFMRASGWPMLNCGMGGLMHPICVISESDLNPKENIERYVDVLYAASEYLAADFLDFFSGHGISLLSQLRSSHPLCLRYRLPIAGSCSMGAIRHAKAWMAPQILCNTVRTPPRDPPPR